MYDYLFMRIENEHFVLSSALISLTCLLLWQPHRGWGLIVRGRRLVRVGSPPGQRRRHGCALAESPALRNTGWKPCAGQHWLKASSCLNASFGPLQAAVAIQVHLQHIHIHILHILHIYKYTYKKKPYYYTYININSEWWIDIWRKACTTNN